MAYVDGFVVPVPKKALPAYRRMARAAGKVWRDHGALEFRESVADDVKVGKWTSFPRSVKLKKGETVVFSWIAYESRAHRDRVNAKVMKDPRIHALMQEAKPPFDMERMLYGGFDVLVASPAVATPSAKKTGKKAASARKPAVAEKAASAKKTATAKKKATRKKAR